MLRVLAGMAGRKVERMNSAFLVRRLIRDVNGLSQHPTAGVCGGGHLSGVCCILYCVPYSVNNLIVVLVIMETTPQIYTCHLTVVHSIWGR